MDIGGSLKAPPISRPRNNSDMESTGSEGGSLGYMKSHWRWAGVGATSGHGDRGRELRHGGED